VQHCSIDRSRIERRDGRVNGRDNISILPAQGAQDYATRTTIHCPSARELAYASPCRSKDVINHKI
jgi:hypothetical protein